MSLINKVLRDLEAQRDADGVPPPLASPLAHDNLRPVKPVMSRLSRPQLLRIGLALAVVAGGAFAWSQWGAKLLETRKTTPASVTAPPAPTVETKTASTVAPGIAPSPPPVALKVEPPPVSETKPAPVAKVTPPPPPAPVKPAAGSAKTETVTAVSPARIAKAAPSVTAPPVAAARTDKDTVVRKPKAEPAPAAPVKAEKPISAPAPAEATEAAEEEPVALEADKPVAKPKDTAKPAGKTVMEKKVKPLSPEDKAESEYRLAATSLQAKRVGAGESHLRAALAAQPAHVKARELLAGLALQGGRWRETQALLEQGLNLTPGYYPYAQLLARVYVDHGSEKKALELLEKSRAAALADADDSRDGGGRAAPGTAAEYFAFLATLYQRAGRHDEAVKSFNEAVKLRPQEGRWWLGAAISLEAVEQWKAAGEAYQRAAASGNLDKQLLQYSQQRLAVVKNK